MNERVTTKRIEPRWPVVLTIVLVIMMLVSMPNRIRLLPSELAYFVGIVSLLPIIAVGLAPAKKWWSRIERATTLLFCMGSVVVMVKGLSILIGEIVWRSGEVSGLQLLASSVAMWASNVLTFSMLYWQIDRGGPDARANNASPRPDWIMPQESVPAEKLPPDWRPEFVDYLFLGFCTAAAFSPTDVLPLTARAKIMMMLESAISLVTIIVVASRAINVLGS